MSKVWAVHMQKYKGKIIPENRAMKEPAHLDPEPLCGGGSYYQPWENIVTENKDNVTCKGCLKKLFKQKGNHTK